ncbi:hypothetical protein BH11ACT3_BH11ACT3_25290 [soil metagenome]
MDFSAEYFARVQSEMQVTIGRMQRAISMLPEATIGWDSSESVGVELDRNAQLARIVFRDDWADQLEPDDLGACVLAASAAAHGRYGSAAEKARATVDALPDSEFLSAGSALDDDPFVRMLSSERPFAGTPRSVGEIAEDFIAIPTPTVEELERAVFADTRDAGDGDEIVIDSAPQNVRIDLQGGRLASIRFDLRWAAHQSGSSLESATAAALHTAQHPNDPPRRRIEVDTAGSPDVIAEALQLLKDLARPQSPRPQDPEQHNDAKEI